MTTEHWSQNDYQQAFDHLEAMEKEDGASPIVHCGEHIYAILPLGLPALGVRFHAWLMLAPLPLLMASVLALPILGFTAGWGLSWVTFAVTLGCGLILWGFFTVLKMMVRNRDIFPRRYFVTLGKRGIAMHFSRWHFPHRSARTAIAWKDVVDIRESRAFFLPGILLAQPSPPVLEVRNKEGEAALVPFNLSDTLQHREWESLKKMISRYRSQN